MLEKYTCYLSIKYRVEMLKDVKYKGVICQYEDIGEGMPVILLHGFCLDNSIWDEVKGQLSKSCRLMLPDLPGFGNSFSDKKDFTIDWYVDMLKELLEYNEIEHCVLLGHSLGGYIALAFAERYPGKLLGFGLINSTAQSDTEERAIDRTKAIKFIKKHGSKGYINELIPKIFSKSYQSSHSKTVEKYKLRALKYEDETITSLLASMKDRPDKSEIIKASKMPLTLIAGKYDETYTLESTLSQASLADMTHFNLLNSGHMSMIESPSDFICSINKFIEHIGMINVDLR